MGNGEVARGKTEEMEGRDFSRDELVGMVRREEPLVDGVVDRTEVASSSGLRILPLDVDCDLAREATVGALYVDVC